MLPKIHQVHRPHPAFIFPALMGFPFPIQAGGFHTQAAPSMSAVPTYPRGFLHMLAPFSHTFPRLPQSPYACADPHRFSRFPIRFRGSPIRSPSSKNPDIGFGKTSVSGPANQAPAGLHEFPAPTAGAVPHVRAGHQIRRDQRPVHSNLRIQPTHSNSNVQRLGGMDDAAASLRRRRQGGPTPACVIGLSGLKARLWSGLGARWQSGLKAGLVVEPGGSTDGTPEGVLVRSDDGPPDGQSGLRPGL